MDTIFDYIVDAAYKIEEYDEDDFFGVTEIEGKFSSFIVVHDLKHAYIERLKSDFNKEVFISIFLEMLNERKRILDIETSEKQRADEEIENMKLQTINYAGSMEGH